MPFPVRKEDLLIYGIQLGESDGDYTVYSFRSTEFASPNRCADVEKSQTRRQGQAAGDRVVGSNISNAFSNLVFTRRDVPGSPSRGDAVPLAVHFNLKFRGPVDNLNDVRDTVTAQTSTFLEMALLGLLYLSLRYDSLALCFWQKCSEYDIMTILHR